MLGKGALPNIVVVTLARRCWEFISATKIRNIFLTICQKGKKSATIYIKGKTNMTSLNLPPFDVRLKGTKQAPLIFDFLRRRYVRLTPEEWVRQHFVHFMVEHRHYPASLLANEVSLHVGDKALRADTILYNKQLQPVMIWTRRTQRSGGYH